MKRAKQPLHDFVMLVNREEDGKVYPATFQSLTYQGNAFAAFGPFTSHTITRTEARTCDECHVNFGCTNAAIEEYNATGEIRFAEWDDATKTLSWVHGVVPIPEDYETALKMDFLTYTGDPSDPPPGDYELWTGIGKDTWDDHQMFFATPLTLEQMAHLGMAQPDGVDPAQAEITRVMLKRAEPNPVQTETRIDYALPGEMDVRLILYDVEGRLIRRLVDSRKPAGGSAGSCREHLLWVRHAIASPPQDRPTVSLRRGSQSRIGIDGVGLTYCCQQNRIGRMVAVGGAVGESPSFLARELEGHFELRGAVRVRPGTPTGVAPVGTHGQLGPQQMVGVEVTPDGNEKRLRHP